MKEKLLIGMLVVFLMSTIAFAQTYRPNLGNLQIAAPSTGLFTTVHANQEYTKTFSIDTTGVSVPSCYDQATYNTGTCSYLHVCKLVLPEGCTSATCAVINECTDITQ